MPHKNKEENFESRKQNNPNIFTSSFTYQSSPSNAKLKIHKTMTKNSPPSRKTEIYPLILALSSPLPQKKSITCNVQLATTSRDYNPMTLVNRGWSEEKVSRRGKGIQNREERRVASISSVVGRRGKEKNGGEKAKGPLYSFGKAARVPSKWSVEELCQHECARARVTRALNRETTKGRRRANLSEWANDGLWGYHGGCT